MSRLVARSVAWLACACALPLACAHEPRAGGAGRDPALRLWVSPVVRWGAGEPRDMRFAIENDSNRTVALAEPDAAYAGVEVYAGAEDDRVCGIEPAPAGTVPEPVRVELAPGDRVELRVDLGRSCRGLPPGEYRFVVAYRSPRPSRPGGEAARSPGPWSGALPAEHGNVLVERGSAFARTPPPRPGQHRGQTRPGPCPEPEAAAR